MGPHVRLVSDGVLHGWVYDFIQFMQLPEIAKNGRGKFPPICAQKSAREDLQQYASQALNNSRYRWDPVKKTARIDPVAMPSARCRNMHNSRSLTGCNMCRFVICKVFFRGDARFRGPRSIEVIEYPSRFAANRHERGSARAV